MSAANESDEVVSGEEDEVPDSTEAAEDDTEKDAQNGTDAGDDADAPDPRPVLRIVRGDPGPDELAALTVVLAAASGSGEAPAPSGPRSGWAERSRLVREPVRPGPGGWRASGLPR